METGSNKEEFLLSSIGRENKNKKRTVLQFFRGAAGGVAVEGNGHGEAGDVAGGFLDEKVENGGGAAKA